MNRQRRFTGFSLRQHLEDQGIKSEEGIRYHLDFVAKTLAINPLLDITRYRVISETSPVSG